MMVLKRKKGRHWWLRGEEPIVIVRKSVDDEIGNVAFY